MDHVEHIDVRQSVTNGLELSKDQTTACLEALQVLGCFTLPVMLKAAMDLDLFEIISRAGSTAGVSAVEIISELREESQPGAAARLDRMLCFLASHGLLKCSLRASPSRGGDHPQVGGSAERIYSLTPSSEYFVDRDKGVSLAPILALSFHPANMKFWSFGKTAILDGVSPFEKANGLPLFQYGSVLPSFNYIFNRAMVAMSTVEMEEILKVYRGFQGLKSLVDVAGGTGKCLSMVVSKHPSIKGINFDLPHVVGEAPSYPGSVEHVGGDMFVGVPQGEAIMIKETLHDWDDECCIQLLKNCYEALPAKGKVIAINILMPEVPDSSAASKYITEMDIGMLMLFHSQERTIKQYEALSVASGFSEFRVSDKIAQSVWTVMEFCK
ncbi:hypothetical protein SAY87_007734 [Trapa incisa]|uniref:Uncharacterized protein n=1 Tax=Trapa incisa TaxID=236973 RepID=A0AAN7KH07_9MYRT|nr:hypothetical protein SAY87_007734 [Trapa incisa]